MQAIKIHEKRFPRQSGQDVQRLGSKSSWTLFEKEQINQLEGGECQREMRRDMRNHVKFCWLV